MGCSLGCLATCLGWDNCCEDIGAFADAKQIVGVGFEAIEEALVWAWGQELGSRIYAGVLTTGAGVLEVTLRDLDRTG